MRGATLAALLLGCSGSVLAADYHAGPEDYREKIQYLQPGDRLLLEPGAYRHGLSLHNLAGRVDQPIAIEAANLLARPRFIATFGKNTVSLVNVRYLVVSHLELDGRNANVDAIKAEGHSRFADYITLQHLYIYNYAASQQNVGISTKCPALGWVVRHNHIERVGTGMYFGDSDGSDPFVGGLIEGNYISRTLGYNLQIKHQKSRDSAILASHDTVIRGNVFSKQGALPGPYARPNVLLGHFPLTGAGSQDRYLVYDNLFLSNPSEALFQAEGRVALYNNVLINESGDAIRIQPHNDVPRDMSVFSNTVVASGVAIEIRRSSASSFKQFVEANIIAANTAGQGGERLHNAVMEYDRELAGSPSFNLGERLLAREKNARELPAGFMKAYLEYPGWKATTKPGAMWPPAWLGLLESRSP